METKAKMALRSYESLRSTMVILDLTEKVYISFYIPFIIKSHKTHSRKQQNIFLRYPAKVDAHLYLPSPWQQ